MSTREDTFINKDGNICMVRCIKCKRENYAMAVYSGMCAWCGHDANADKSLKPEEKKDEEKTMDDMLTILDSRIANSA